MVLAGPGSGKTLVITNRTKYLIEEYGINPSNILVITFTKAAANEMQERFFNLMNNHSLPVTFGTFHAVFFKILRYAYNYKADNILREDIKYQYIGEIIEKMQLEYEDANEFISSIVGEIGVVKGDMINPQYYHSMNCADNVFREIYEKYNDKLRNVNKVDFDDMLVMCYELLKNREDILDAWRRKYQYILIDEFQDINKVQYEVIRLLAAENNNLFIVGDDDQSIYRFRGAKPEIMLGFANDYGNCEKIILEENYRSSQEIVEASLRLIKNNRKRYEKNIRAVKGKSGNVEYRTFKSAVEENDYIINILRKYASEGYGYGEVAIICRTNIGPRLLVQKMMEYNIPFKMKDSMPNIYEHWITKNFLTYIKIALGDMRRSEFFQIMNKPNRYIPRDAITESEVSFEKLEALYVNKEWMYDRICRLQYDLQQIRKMTPFAAVSYIYDAVRYREYLKEYAEYRRMNLADLENIVDEIKESARPFKTYSEWFEYIESYSEELRLQAGKKSELKDAVEIVTMHSAKGLEYRVVIIADANEGVMPHSKALLDEDIEEERRMFYVGVTRAKEKLHIYSVNELHGKKSEISRFVNELNTDNDMFLAGRKVHHKKFGEGEIRKNDGDKIAVYFYEIKTIKTFNIKFSIDNKLFEIT